MIPNEWSNQQIGTQVEEIDRFRRIFGEMIESMAEAEDGRLRGSFARFIIQLERYFDLENQLMQGIEFPRIEQHLEEHEQMLIELSYFKERIENGLFALGRTYITVRLPEWFQEHAETHDQELCDFLLGRGDEVRSAA